MAQTLAWKVIPKPIGDLDNAGSIVLDDAQTIVAVTDAGGGVVIVWYVPVEE